MSTKFNKAAPIGPKECWLLHKMSLHVPLEAHHVGVFARVHAHRVGAAGRGCSARAKHGGREGRESARDAAARDARDREDRTAAQFELFLTAQAQAQRRGAEAWGGEGRW